MPHDPILAERVRHLLADRADFHEKRLMGGIAFMVKGGMCCAASGRGGLLVRVQPDKQAALLAPPVVVPMTMGGRKVKSFIAAWRQWLNARPSPQGRGPSASPKPVSTSGAPPPDSARLPRYPPLA